MALIFLFPTCTRFLIDSDYQEAEEIIIKSFGQDFRTAFKAVNLTLKRYVHGSKHKVLI